MPDEVRALEGELANTTKMIDESPDASPEWMAAAEEYKAWLLTRLDLLRSQYKDPDTDA